MQSPGESGSLSPSQIRARERERKQEQAAQILQQNPPKNLF